jgi:hypothetical protein
VPDQLQKTARVRNGVQFTVMEDLLLMSHGEISGTQKEKCTPLEAGTRRLMKKQPEKF